MFNKFCIIFLFLITMPFSGRADSFNTSFLVGNTAASQWNSDIEIEPGTYDFNLYINDRWLGTFPIFVKDGTRESIYLSLSDMSDFGLKLDRYPKDVLDNDSGFISIEAMIAGGSFHFDPNGFNLSITMPQAYIDMSDVNWVDKKNWDQGINGAYVNYHANYFNNYDKETEQYNESLFLSLNSGLNLFGIHFVDVGSVTSGSGQNNGTGYINTYRYAEKALLDIDSLIRVGKQPSSTSYFDSIKHTGVSLRKDMRMLPDSYGRYMPVIRGVAAEQAVVTIRQDGRVIERLNIPVGEYRLDQLMPTGSRSDLEVTLTYSSGRQEHFIVPFSTISGMLREGSSDYNIHVGRVEDGQHDDLFIQGEYTRGVNNFLTGYGGATWSDDYQSYLLGSAISIPSMGSVSFDIEHSMADLNHLGHYQGQKYHLSYSKYFSTKINLTLASYFYKTGHYLSLQDSLRAKDYRDESYLSNRVKEGYSINLNQPIGKGQVYFDGYFSRKSGVSSFDKQFNLAYNQTMNGVHYSVTLGRSYTHYDFFNERNSVQENRMGLSISVPLSVFDNKVTLTGRVSALDEAYRSSDVILSGYEEDLTYSLNMGHDKDSNSYLSAYASYQASKVYLNASYSESNGTRQMAAGASGSLLAYHGGVLASSQTGSNFVVVEAPGIEGATINNDHKVRTNSDGQALVATASPYRKNTYTIQNEDAQGSITGNMKYVVPLRGAISKVSYTTDTAKRFVFQVSDALPFGSEVFNEAQEAIGYVLQGGRITFRSEVALGEVWIRYLKEGDWVECRVNLQEEEESKRCE